MLVFQQEKKNKYFKIYSMKYIYVCALDVMAHFFSIDLGYITKQIDWKILPVSDKQTG